MQVDLNADLGESFGAWRLGDDAALLQLVSSANIACGFHAGDPLTLQRACAAAVAAGVRVGAQVSYRDLAGFGRRFVDATEDELRADLLYQLGALDGLARVAGGRVAYVKAHGALYHATLAHEPHARALVAAVAAYDPALPILGMPRGHLAALAAAAGLTVVPEAFADRAYTAVGDLVSRRDPGAVLHDPAEVAERVVRLVTTGRLTAVDGTDLGVPVASVCLHGDTPGAVALARAVRAGLTSAGVTIAPFAALPP